MKVNTRLFGEIEIQDDKIITLDKGIVGFPDLTRFTIIYDTEKEEKTAIMWFQSLDEPQFAMPVVTPGDIVPDYNPTVNDELLEPLGELTEENLYVLVTIKVPKKIEDMTINLKAHTRLGGIEPHGFIHPERNFVRRRLSLSFTTPTTLMLVSSLMSAFKLFFLFLFPFSYIYIIYKIYEKVKI